MRLLADENVPGVFVATLREAGHDVAWVRTDAPGSADREILSRAQDEGRIILTFDKDFGDLAFRFGLPSGSGIVLFRLPPPATEHEATLLATILASRDDWAGHFAVVERGRIRIRPLPV